jgi:outer membrane scaffolding protein for murein synthesis (MipA/OmpV family)
MTTRPKSLSPQHHLPALAGRGLLAAGLALAAQAAQAQAFDAVRLFAIRAGDGQGIVGAAVIAGHEYLGSSETKLLVLPAIDYQWKNGWFVGTGNGVGYRFPSPANLQYGLRITVDGGRSDNDAAALQGMGAIPVRPEIGAFLNFLITDQWFITSSIRYGSGQDWNGAQFDLGAGYSVQFAPQWRLGLGLAGTYVNRDYMQTFYGVSPTQAAATGYAPYAPGAGWRDLRGNATLTYSFDERWSLTASVQVRSLQGGPTHSPIVDEDTPVSGVLALGYTF